MPLSSAVFLVSAAAYAGFQWTVQWVVYPQFALVPPLAFTEYERVHQRRISHVVGPLFAALVLSTGWLAVNGPAGPAAAAVAVGLVAVVLGVTAFVAVPLHRRLSAGWDPAAHRSLLRADLVRTAAATGLVVIGVVGAVVPG